MAGDPRVIRSIFSKPPPPEMVPYLTGEKQTSAHFWMDSDGRCHAPYDRLDGLDLKPEVIVVTSPHPPSVIGKLYVGTLEGFEPGRDPGDWWLILSDTADGWREVSIPWPDVRKVMLRYD